MISTTDPHATTKESTMKRTTQANNYHQFRHESLNSHNFDENMMHVAFCSLFFHCHLFQYEITLSPFVIVQRCCCPSHFIGISLWRSVFLYLCSLEISHAGNAIVRSASAWKIGNNYDGVMREWVRRMNLTQQQRQRRQKERELANQNWRPNSSLVSSSSFSSSSWSADIN